MGQYTPLRCSGFVPPGFSGKSESFPVKHQVAPAGDVWARQNKAVLSTFPVARLVQLPRVSVRRGSQEMSYERPKQDTSAAGDLECRGAIRNAFKLANISSQPNHNAEGGGSRVARLRLLRCESDRRQHAAFERIFWSGASHAFGRLQRPPGIIESRRRAPSTRRRVAWVFHNIPRRRSSVPLSCPLQNLPKSSLLYLVAYAETIFLEPSSGTE